MTHEQIQKYFKEKYGIDLSLQKINDNLKKMEKIRIKMGLVNRPIAQSS